VVGFVAVCKPYDAAKVSPLLALRNAVGVALPLVTGVATGELSGGLVVSTGAMNVVFSDSQEPYNRRAGRMFAASALVGLAVLVGSLCGQQLYRWSRSGGDPSLSAMPS